MIPFSGSVMICTRVTVLLLLSACATTKLSSMREPSASGEYSSLLVVAPLGDVEFQSYAEERLLSKLGSPVLSVVRYSSLFLPGVSYPPDEITAKTAPYQFDAVLVISMSDAGVKIEHSAHSRTYNIGQNVYTNTQMRSYNKPWANFAAHLYDAATGRVVWVAMAKSRGNAFAKTKSLLNSMASKVAVGLQKDGMLKKGPKSKSSRRY